MVSERKHFDNLCYIRGLLKYDIDQWAEDNRNGEITRFEDVMDMLTDLSIVEECIAGLYSKCEILKVARKHDKTQ